MFLLERPPAKLFKHLFLLTGHWRGAKTEGPLRHVLKGNASTVCQVCPCLSEGPGPRPLLHRLQPLFARIGPASRSLHGLPAAPVGRRDRGAETLPGCLTRMGFPGFDGV